MSIGGIMIIGLLKSRTYLASTASKLSFLILPTILLLNLTFSFSSHVYALSNQALSEAEQDLKEFHENPAKFLDRIPPKWDSSGNRIRRPTNDVSANEIRKVRTQERETLFFDGWLEGRSAVIPGDEDVFSFLDVSEPLTDLKEIENQKLLSSNVTVQPWSDHYWPIYAGVLGTRFGDPEYYEADDWKENFDYVKSKPASEILANGDQSLIDTLSPSEKYDILVGDSGFLLTQTQWNQGKPYYDRDGKVERWMGICHGWAPAAFMLKRPQHSVPVMGPDGQVKLKFYPSDIKALASLLWATTKTPVSFLGGRCNDKEPKKDEVGRIISQDCFDTNPGTWHLTVVNQIGVDKKSMVIDATFDYEVWNQPLVSYSYSYFNPETLKTSTNLEQSKVSLSDFSKDKFKKYRGPDAKSVVGIIMQVQYMMEVHPSTEETDSEQNDNVVTARYMYDLELDKNDKIIGGEWYNNKHPDFLWRPTKKARALTQADYYILSESWNAREPVPMGWRNLAQRVSKNGQPLAKIVEALVDASQNPNTEILFSEIKNLDDQINNGTNNETGEVQ
jgi:hypothetical protein